MTEIISQVQVAERVFAMSRWCDTSRQSAQLWNSQSPECGTTLLGIERAQISIYLFRPCVQNSPTKDWRGQSSRLNPRKSGSEVIQGLDVVTKSPTLLGLVLVWSQQNYCIWNCCWPWGIPSPRGAPAPMTLHREKAGIKMNEMNNTYVNSARLASKKVP